MNPLADAESSAAQLADSVAAGSTRDAARLTWWDREPFRGSSATEVIARGVELEDARHVIARESGFANWERLVAYRQAWDTDPGGPVGRFEAAAEAVVGGDRDTLRRLLSSHGELAYARSPRDHHATLLHYVAANGVEDSRQRTPPNVVELAQLLIESGADSVVNATADIYGGGPGSTPLIALVTSAHPYHAGRQPELIRLFCNAGAKVEGIDDSGLPLQSAIGFRYLAAARALVDCGARVDNLPSAAALGDRAAVEAMLTKASPSGPCQFPNPHHPPLKASVAPHPEATLQQALVFAAMGGQPGLVDRFRDVGGHVNAPARGGIRALHEAAWQGNESMVQYLLELGGDPTLRDEVWKSTAAEWAEAGGHPGLARLLSEA